MTRDQRSFIRAAGFVLAVFATTSAYGQSTYVQGIANRPWTQTTPETIWADGDLTTPPTSGGGAIPNAVGAVAILQQRVTSDPNLSGNTSHGIPLSGTTVTVGALTVRNADNTYTTALQNGTLVFDNGESDAVMNELSDGVFVPPTGVNTGRTRLNLPVVFNSNMVVNQAHNLMFNTATEFVQVVNQEPDKTFTKIGLGNLQFAYSSALGAAEGIRGDVFINEGAIRLINTGAVNLTNTVFAQAKSITVANGAQFQLGNRVETFTMPETSEIRLNGIGKPTPPPGVTYAMPEGALRFENQSGLNQNVQFNAKIVLQTTSQIRVAGGDVTANLNYEISGGASANLNKGGLGLLKLARADGNSYAGNTVVSNGGLSVNNTNPATSAIGSGNVNVTSGGKLGGTGTIGTSGDASNVTVTQGFLSPGNLAIEASNGPIVEHAGTLTVNGDVTLTSLGHLNMDIGATSDMLVASGAIDLGDSRLRLNLGEFVPSGPYTLISNTGVGAIGGTFGTLALINNLTNPALDTILSTPDFDLNGETYHLSYTGGDGNDVVLVPGATPVGLPGDFNNDEVVDAADYVMWRRYHGTDNTLSGNGDETPPSNGVVDEADYDYWTAHFGNPGEGGGGTDVVPEPGAIMLALVAAFGMLTFGSRRSIN